MAYLAPKISLLVVSLVCSGLVATATAQAVTSSDLALTPATTLTATSSPSLLTPVAPIVSPINLTVSPVSLSLETDPGVPVQAAIKIRNNSDTAEQLNITFGTFTADASGQRPKLLDPTANDRFMGWLSADKTAFTVEPGEWTTVNLSFTPPADAALSYYYTVMINRSSQLSKPGETVIQGSPAVLVLTTVRSPNAKRQVELTKFSVNWPFVEYLPQTFQVEIKNTGNVHVMPMGNIFIDGQGQKDLAVLSLNPANSAILPQSTRTLEIQWKDGFPVKNVASNEKLDPNQSETGLQLGGARWDFSTADKLRFGKYTAHLLMVYDNGERDVPIESFVSFWVIPWKLLLVGLAIVILAGLGARSVLVNVWQWLKHRFRRS